MVPRRFSLPWIVQRNRDAYWVEDAGGQRFGYCYSRENKSVGSGRQSYLTEDQARRIVSNVAKLPDLIKATQG